MRDVDVAVDGDPKAGRAGRRRGGPRTRLRAVRAFGAWRVIDGRAGLVYDLSPLQGDSIEQDLAGPGFTVNAMARPLRGGELIDPCGGRADLDMGLLRVVGRAAYEADPLRPLPRRLVARLGLRADREPSCSRARPRRRVARAAPEQVFAELRRLLTASGCAQRAGLADRLGLLAAVLPELVDLHDVEQATITTSTSTDTRSRWRYRQDEVEGRLDELFGALAPRLRGARAAARPRADARQSAALRGAPPRHRQAGHARREPDRRVTFIGHDSRGEEMVRALCRRLRTASASAAFSRP